MSSFNFGRGRTVFSHSSKRLRPVLDVELADDYILGDFFDQDLDLPFDVLEHELEEITSLEPLHEELVDEEATTFTDFLRGAQLLQGSVVEVYHVNVINEH